MTARSSVAAITRNAPSRSRRRYAALPPLDVELARTPRGRSSSGETTVTRAPHAARPAAFSWPDRAAADDDAAAPRHVEAGHVEVATHSSSLALPATMPLLVGVGLDELVHRGDAAVERVVDLHERLPVVRDRVLRQDRLDRALGLAGAAVDALLRVDHEHAVGLVDAVDGADALARDVLHVDAGFADDVRHACFKLLSSLDGLRPVRAGARPRSPRSRSSRRILQVRPR